MGSEKENANVENSSDGRGHSFRDFFAGKSLCSELGIKSGILPLPSYLASHIHTADLLSVKISEENVYKRASTHIETILFVNSWLFLFHLTDKDGMRSPTTIKRTAAIARSARKSSQLVPKTDSFSLWHRFFTCLTVLIRVILLKEKAYTFLVDATLTIAENERLVLAGKEVESGLCRVGG